MARILARDKILELQDYMRKYFAKNGYSPTYREMAEAIGVASTATIHLLVKTMMDDGLVHMVRGKSRTLRLVERDEDTGGLPGGTGGT